MVNHHQGPKEPQMINHHPSNGDPGVTKILHTDVKWCHD